MSEPKKQGMQSRSRRTFLAGAVAGAAGTWALTSLPRRLFQDKDRPPWISEFFLDNFWFDAREDQRRLWLRSRPRIFRSRRRGESSRSPAITLYLTGR